jgi:hypothetical protein
MKKVFISYSDNDIHKVRSLERIIKKEKRHLTTIIVADKRQGLKALTKKVEEGIIECDYFVPILTANSINNQWVNQEIGFAFAKGCTIYPIVEHQVMDRLKGFIHKQLALEYTFERNKKNIWSEALSFANAGKTLKNDILFQNNILPQNVTIGTLFPGKWESHFTNKDNKKSVEPNIEIINPNKYLLDGQLAFTLKEIKIDTEKKRIQFVKTSLSPNGRRIENSLMIEEIFKRYKGTELDNNGDKFNIVYERVE